MTKQYVVFFERDSEVGGFGVVFPDLPGCISHGKTYEDAIRMAQEALELYAEGENLPKPRTLEEIQETWEDWDKWKSRFDFVVDYISLPYKSEKTYLSEVTYRGNGLR